MEAFLEKYEARKIRKIPVISDIILNQRTKNVAQLSNHLSFFLKIFIISKGKADLLDINFPMLEYTNQELQEITENIFTYLVPKGI